MESFETRQIRVIVDAAVALSREGIVSCLCSDEGVTVVPAREYAGADAVVLAAESLTPQVVAALRQISRDGLPIVLVADEIAKADLPTVVECRVVAVLPRAMATAQRLRESVKAAASGSNGPPEDLVRELAQHLEQFHAETSGPADLGLDEREKQVLRLMAEGLDAAEIGAQLCYAERTIENIVYGITGRLNVRNRTHAVAYAMRAGAI